MTKLFSIVIVSFMVVLNIAAHSAVAGPQGFTCAHAAVLLGGGNETFTLQQTSNDVYAMSLTRANADGTSAVTQALGDQMECVFSASDVSVSYCKGLTELIPSKHLSDFLQSMKQSTSAVNPWGYDATKTGYVLKIAAPLIDDRILSAMDPLNYNPKNKSLTLNFDTCKAL